MRTKICGKHQRAASVPGALGVDEPARFCQACHTLHPLAAFKGATHNCAAKLVHLAQVRAVRRAERAVFSADAATEPLFSLLSTDSPSSGASQLTAQQDNRTDAWCDADLPSLEGALFGDWPWQQSGPLSLELKLQVPSPHHLPPGGLRPDVDALGDELLAALGGADDDVLGPLGADALWSGSICPGCVLLTLDYDAPPRVQRAMQQALGHEHGSLAAAARQASPLFATTLDAGHDSAALRLTTAGLPHLSATPAAALSSAPGAITLSLGPEGHCGRPRCRLNGRPLDVQVLRQEGDTITVTLGATDGLEGVALLDMDATASAAPRPGASLTQLLLTSQPAVVHEVNVTAMALQARFGHGGEARGALDGALWALGCALAVARDRHLTAAPEQHLPLHRRRHAFQAGAAAALRFGWPSALQECLQGLQALSKAQSGGAPLSLGEEGAHTTLLHQAAAGAGAQAVSALLIGASPRDRGMPTSMDTAGRTPLHVAAAASLGDTLLAMCGDVDGGAPAALVSFACDADRLGRTAAQLALSSSCAHTVSVARSLLHRVNAGIRLANSGAPEHDKDEASCIAALLLDQAATNAAGILSAQHLARGRARGARCMHALVTMIYGGCIFLRPRGSSMHDDAEIAQFKAALPCPPWSLWQQVPTAMCCSSDCWMVVLRHLVLALATLVLYTPTQRGTALRAAGGSTAVAVALLLHFLIIDPTLTAFATYARYGTLALRQPDRAFLRVATYTAVSHGLLDNTVPLPLYAAILVVRASLPLLARVGQALQLEPLGRVRLLGMHPELDVLHALLCSCCLLHAVHAARARRRRPRVSGTKQA